MVLTRLGWFVLWAQVAFALAYAAMATEPAKPIRLPDKVVFDSLVKEYGPVTFSHTIHVEKAKACSLCHHHFSAEEIGKCAACHDIKHAAMKESLVEGFLSCKSCHRKFAPANPALPGLMTAYHIQCFSCHKTADKIEGPAACAKKCHTPAPQLARKEGAPDVKR